MIQFNITGEADIRRKLAEFEPKLARRAGIQAIASGGKVLRLQAEANARALFRRGTGKLFRNFKQKVFTRGTSFGREIVARVYLSQKAWHGRLLEKGWKHRGRAKRGAAGSGTPVPARPFLKPALTQARGAAFARVAEVLREKLGLAARP